ncbi:MAG: hypothetical protein H7301_01315 [Cryobacterium sp.]|nr:hypothetical protein [Oligoflexia bacterium]
MILKTSLLAPAVFLALTLYPPALCSAGTASDPAIICQNLLVETSIASETREKVSILGRYLVEDYPVIQSDGFYGAVLRRIQRSPSPKDPTVYLNLVVNGRSKVVEIREAANKTSEFYFPPSPTNAILQSDFDKMSDETFARFIANDMKTDPDWLALQRIWDDSHPGWRNKAIAWKKEDFTRYFPRRVVPAFTNGIQDDFIRMSEEVWNDIAAGLLDPGAARNASDYRLSKKELPIIQAMIRTINVEPTLREGVVQLISEVIYHSVPHLKNILQMRKNDTLRNMTEKENVVTNLLFAPFIGVVALLRPTTYCYIGNCAKVAATQGSIEREAYEAAVGKSEKPEVLDAVSVSPPQVGDLKSVSLHRNDENFHNLRTLLSTLPSRTLLEEDSSIPAYDREIRRNLHESALLGLEDHEIFSNASLWQNFRSFIDEHPDAERYGRVKFVRSVDRYRMHVENYAQSLKFQIEGISAGRKTYEAMKNTLLHEVTQAKSPSTLRQRETSALAARIESQLLEASTMENSLEKWLIKTDRIQASLERILATADPVRAAPLTEKEIKKLKIQILNDVGIHEDKAWYRF